MRRAVFLLSFFVVVAATMSGIVSWVPGIERVSAGLRWWLGLLRRFSDPIPSIISMHIPLVLRLLLSLIFAILVVRRLVAFGRERRFNIPNAYSGVPYALLCLSAVSLVAGVIALVAVTLFPLGDLMVAIRILNPAMLLAPLAIAWGEIKSIGSSNQASP
ncbi:hypothetical protein F7Q92_16070 [Ideonella dechloratans]|uniref:Uncharacterized protein n=1 Tax=Ideonella dechloratans TaxID=36863 RepID=A0A643F8K6_IDEDE|nr:hypothetical protein [Ideonella dechloratans]KAB0577783.1 hypothetical protein F7Q92_16070 [Ideonella dechloratans]UFU11959.1 hypothetical protein LRM40_19690 [Ideonella dechloratans]